MNDRPQGDDGPETKVPEGSTRPRYEGPGPVQEPDVDRGPPSCPVNGVLRLFSVPRVGVVSVARVLDVDLPRRGRPSGLSRPELKTDPVLPGRSRLCLWQN